MSKRKAVNKQHDKQKIPNFKTIQEEAEFWDSHDTIDYADEFRPTKVEFAKNLSEAITIRFDPKVLQQIRTEANKKGIGPTTLIRMWVMERVRPSV